MDMCTQILFLKAKPIQAVENHQHSSRQAPALSVQIYRLDLVTPALLLSAVESIPPKHPHFNPQPPPFKIPSAEWPRVVHRVVQGESLRQVASSYRVSYEAIRRIVAAARRAASSSDKEPLE